MANYTAVAAGGAWNVSTTWSPAGVPGAADTAILNSSSGNVTVPAAGATCATLTLTGYTGTLLLNGNLTIVTSGLNLGSFTGTINFSAGDIILPDGLFNLGNASVYTTLGTGGVLITKPSASFSIFNTDNKIWNCKFALGATGSTSPTIYFEDNPLEVTGLVSFQATTTGTYNLISGDIFTPNLVFLKMSGDFTISGSTIYTTTTGGQNIGFTGSANQTLTASGTHQLRCPLIINKTGGVLTLSGTLNYNTGTLAYVASGGTVNAGSSTLNIAASTTLNTNGITWNNIATTGTGTTTITLSSNLTWSGTMSLMVNTLNLNGATRTTTFSGSSLTPSSVATISVGNNNYGTSSQTNVVNFPTSSILNITTLTIGCGGNSSVGYNTTINNATINISQNLTIAWQNQGISLFNGTSSQINMVGSGTVSISGFNSLCYIAIPFTINTAGTYNFVGTPFFSSNVNYIAGTLTGVSCYFITGANLNFTAGLKWETSVIMRGNITLSSNVIFGNLTTDTTTVVLSGAFTINVEGNLAINITTSGASTPIVLNGTGSQSWTHGSAVYLSNNLTINKASGTLTLGANVYYTVGTLTYTQGDVEVTTNNNTFVVTGGTYNVEGLNFNTFYFATSGASSITLASNLYARTFTCGGNSTINGTFDVYCSYFNMNNLSSGQTSTTLTYSGVIYCSNDATFSGSTSSCRITGDLYVGGSCYHNAPASASQGAANLYMVGNGELRAPSTAGTFTSNLYFNTSGKITITGSISYQLGASRTINLIKGNVDARKATLTLNRAFTHTLTNMNKMVWGNVVLDTTSAMGLNMNEFFSGDATTQTNITATNTAINGTVTFTDNFEKIAKFVNISGCTLSRPQQLLVITDSKKSSTNTKGIRYINSLPNGISKGDPSIQNILTPGQSSNLLIADPAFVKTI